LITEIVAENAERVKDAERIVKRLKAIKGTDEGAWMTAGNESNLQSEARLVDKVILGDRLNVGDVTSKPVSI